MKKTRNLLKISLLALILALSISSCDKEEDAQLKDGEGTLSMSLAVKAKKSSATPDALILTIEDENGGFFYENERVELLNMGENYITAPITIDAGNYSITYFTVVDSADNIIYAAPMEESDLAEFVYDPLPIDFEIIGGEVTNIAPEVIEVVDQTPEDFGYMGISFEVNELITFIIKPIVYNPETNEYELAPVTAYLIDENGDTVASNRDPGTFGLKANNGPFSRSLSNLEDNRQQKDEDGNDVVDENGDPVYEVVFWGIKVTISKDFAEEVIHNLVMKNDAFGFYANTVFNIAEAIGYDEFSEPIQMVLDEVLPQDHHLIVINGTGSGDYNKGREVPITAVAPEAGQTFINWTGSTGVANPNTTSTTFKVSQSIATITANFGYNLTTVNCSSEGGVYPEGTSLTIFAEFPAPGYTMSHWLINGSVYDHTEVYLQITTVNQDLTIEAVHKLDCPETFISNGITYATVAIGEQCWMANNVMDDAVTGDFIYGNDFMNEYEFGRLYTYEAAQSICPAGWHLPTDAEWMEVEMALGMSSAEANSTGGTRGEGLIDDIIYGGSSGLNIQFGGYRNQYNNYALLGSTGYFWTDSDIANPMVRQFNKPNVVAPETPIDRVVWSPNWAASVRCVKDK